MVKAFEEANENLLKKRKASQEAKSQKNVQSLSESGDILWKEEGQKLYDMLDGDSNLSARRKALSLRQRHPQLAGKIEEMFKKVSEGHTFECYKCKKVEESVFNNSFLGYNRTGGLCKLCEAKKKIERAHEVLDRKVQALKDFEITRQADITRMILKSGAHERFAAATLEEGSFIAGKSYFLKGTVGTGKTHMSIGLMRQWLSKIEPVYDDRDNTYKFGDTSQMQPLFIEVPELLLEIREAYSGNGTVTDKQIVDYYASAPFLVLDDLGVEKASEFSSTMIYLIINRRYAQQRPTVITSNLELDDIRDRLSERISSRIRGMCVPVAVKGSDRRDDELSQHGID